MPVKVPFHGKLASLEAEDRQPSDTAFFLWSSIVHGACPTSILAGNFSFFFCFLQKQALDLTQTLAVYEIMQKFLSLNRFKYGWF